MKPETYMKVGLNQRQHARRLCCRRVLRRSTHISQDSRVDAIREPRVTVVRVCTNPVVAHRLIRVQNERVPLAGEDVDRVNLELLVVDAVNFNDGHIVIINREREVGVAGDGNKTEAVTLAGSDGDHSEVGCRTIDVATFAVDESRVEHATGTIENMS